jgi:integrase/recombinase XerD
MEDEKELVIIKILSELQEKYDLNNIEVKNILDKHLSNYSLLSNETGLMVTDLPEKINFFLGLKSLEGKSKKTLERYQSELMMFSMYCLKPTAQIDVNDIRRYFALIHNERHYESITINGKLSILRSFFGTLYKEEIVPKDPTVRLKNMKVDVKNLREYLSIEELEKVRNACLTIRDKAMVEFLYSTAVRVSEAVGTNINDSLFVAERRPHNPLTKSGFEKAISKIGERANINRSVYPHILRHSFATHALQQGMDITQIQQLLGHEQINTTQIYAKNNSRQLQAAYDRLMLA